MLGSLGKTVARAWSTPNLQRKREDSSCSDEGAVGLITSSKRRGPDSSGDALASKRQRVSSRNHTKGDEGSKQLDGQLQPQGRPPVAPQQHHGHHHHRRRRGTLGSILSPVYFLLQQGSQQLAQHFGGTPAPDKQRPRGEGDRWQSGQQQQQRQQPQLVINAEAGGSDTAADSAQQGSGDGSSFDTGGSAHSPVASSGAKAGGDSGACESDGAAGAGEEVSGGRGGAKAAAEGDADVTEEEEDDEEEDDDEEDDPLIFISRLPASPPPTTRRGTGTLLPRRTRTTRPRTLVLDLDETLVHATLDDEPGAVAPDFTFTVPFNGRDHAVAVRMRPHVIEFLERAAELFEVVVFTASQRVYAERLLNVLDPGRRLIKHRLYRDACVFYDGNYMKDLSGLGRDLALTAIVDNSPQAFGFQVDNGIPIESWYDDAADTELLALLPLLERLAEAEDVRPVLRERFRLREKAEAAGADWRRRVEAEAAEAAAARAAQRACATEQRRAAAVGSLVQQVLPSPLRAAAAALGCA